MTQEQLPNVILITNHDSGNHMGTLGSQFPTPNLDRLAEKGAVFENNFCTAPQCSPSRGSFLTGKLPHDNGLMGLTNLGWDLPTSNITIPKLMKKRGYSTHLIGLQHVHRDAETIGYDTVSPRLMDAPFIGKRVRKRAKKFFRSIDKGDYEKPFYAKIGFFEPHRPFFTGLKYRPKKKDIEVPPYLPDTKPIRRAIKKFAGSLGVLDASVGEVLDVLEQYKFSENTLIIYTVDHGWAMPRAKGTLYDPGIRTSLAVYWPNKIEAGVRIKEMTSGVDICPTIMDLIGKPLSDVEKRGMQGKSFKPLLFPDESKEDYESREYIISELTYHDHGYNPIRGLRTKKWKYIYNFTDTVAGEDRLFEIPTDISNRASGKSFIEHHPEWKHKKPQDELYDLDNDPNEFENVAEKEEYQDVRKNLREKLMGILKASNDPVLEGKVEAPADSGPILM